MGPQRPHSDLLYKTVILPRIMYAAPIWKHKNISDLNKFQNNIIRSVFRHCLSPPIAASEVLPGIPPLDLYGDSLDIKFLIKVTLQSDIVSTAHAEALPVESTAHDLQCSLNRYPKYFNINDDACFYTNEMVAESINNAESTLALSYEYLLLETFFCTTFWLYNLSLDKRPPLGSYNDMPTSLWQFFKI